jgi:hypothetical protein
MASYFRLSRNIELSTLEFLTTNLNADWSGVTVIKTFKDAYDTGIPVPIVCARLASANNARLELGSTTLDNRYLIIVDVFARSDAQRIDISDYVVDKLRLGWTYKAYSHVSGDKSQIIGTADGRVFVTDWLEDMKIDYGENADPKDRYRQTISILVRKSS